MNSLHPILAVIPARGGSKGLPGKNIRSLGGLPLIAHSIKLASLCPEIDRVIVSTDSPEIAAVAKQHGADVPFLRPPELARDDTAMWPVLRHAHQEMERRDQRQYGALILLDPTSPGRYPEDIHGAVEKLAADPRADGIVGVSEPEFNPIWTCVVEQNGFMGMLVDGGNLYSRRQDVPAVYRINATLYMWRRRLLIEESTSWKNGTNLLYVVPECRSIHIDTFDDFEKTETLLRAGYIRLPWLAA